MGKETFTTAAKIGPSAWDSMRQLPRRTGDEAPVTSVRVIHEPEVQAIEVTPMLGMLAKPDQKVWGGKTSKEDRSVISESLEESERGDIEVTLALLDGIQTDSDGAVFQASNIKQDYAKGTRDLLVNDIIVKPKKGK